MSNPGNFRIELDTAKSGGISDPRNGTMLKMLNLIDIGERAGSGLPDIFRVWRDMGWIAPMISESFDPDRIMLSLTFKKNDGKKSAINERIKESIIDYLTDCAEAKTSTIAEYIGLKSSRTRDYLNELIAEGIVIAEGSNKKAYIS